MFSKRLRLDYHGFTATELIIVVALLAILAAVAMPSFIGAIKKYRINAAARHLVSDLRLAQSNAVSTGKRYRILFNSSNFNQYKMQMEVASNWQDVTGWTDLSTTYTGITVQSAPPSPYDVIFNSRGALDGAAGDITITIRDPAGTTKNIVTKTSGKVSIT